MKEAKDHIIVIGREFGAGGRKLGREIAHRLGIPYYDKELLSEAARRLGFKQEIFDLADERRPSILHALLNFNFNSPTAHFSTSSMNAEDLYALQSRVIRQIAAQGPCVIVGRTADYILREHPNLVSVFVHADPKIRAQRIMERGDASSIDDAQALAIRMDKLRREYYNYFSGKKWGHSSSYHLSIDSSRHSAENLASNVIHFIETINQ
ncbi:MAG: cytidylate kinase-like family protein [Bacteroidales bacterium]|nr:cytidylate kinase-like family protein [Bacteroidales bacterium]